MINNVIEQELQKRASGETSFSSRIKAVPSVVHKWMHANPGKVKALGWGTVLGAGMGAGAQMEIQDIKKRKKDPPQIEQIPFLTSAAGGAPAIAYGAGREGVKLINDIKDSKSINITNTGLAAAGLALLGLGVNQAAAHAMWFRPAENGLASIVKSKIRGI